MYKHIMVPVDLDDPAIAEKALETAKEMAKRDAAKLTVISVQPIVADETMTMPPDYRPKLDAYVKRHSGGVDMNAILKLGGSVAGEIRYAAEEIGADLIVMGTHDPQLSDYLLGSNAAHVALHTPCSVLVVR